MGLNPFERWDDWEWERAAQEVGKERGYVNNWQEGQRVSNSRFRWEKFNWTGRQKQTLMAALLFLTIFFSAHNNDPVSKAVHGVYRSAMKSGNYYTALNGMAKEAVGLGISPESMPVDVKMQGKFQPPLSGAVMAEFGSKDSNGQMHNGIDIGSALGTPVAAPYTGVVVLVGEESQLGRLVKLDLGAGWTAVLSNFGDIAVAQGQKVEKGQYLGTVGLSAALKKPWLHFELRKNGKAVNPMPYLLPTAN